MKTATEACPSCGGTGSIRTLTGSELREARTLAQLRLRDVAERMGVSVPYLSDVERGNRGVTPRAIEAYEQTIEAATKGQK